MCGCFSWKGSASHHHLISRVFSSAHKSLFLIFCTLGLTWNGTMWHYAVRHLLDISRTVCLSHIYTGQNLLYLIIKLKLQCITLIHSAKYLIFIQCQILLFMKEIFIFPTAFWNTQSLAFIGKDGDIRITLTGRFSHIIIQRQRFDCCGSSSISQDDLLLDQSHFLKLNRSF